MPIKSVAGISCYVKDLKKTVAFYTKLGFKFKIKGPDMATGYMNWFWITFMPIAKETKPNFKEEAKLKDKGAGMYLYMSVDDVDAFYKSIRAKGFKPSTAPRDWPWGNREFVLRDPDRYKIVFFKKK